MTVLINISKEIEQHGEPANPGLSKAFFESYRTLDVGGAIIGFRGMGKTLLSSLSALAKKPALVVDVSKAMKLDEGEYRLDEVSNCAVLRTVGRPLMKWVTHIVGNTALTANCDKGVKVEGRGLKRLVYLTKQLRDLHILPILDGFEGIVLRPEEYGYTWPRLLEDLFNFVDVRVAPFGLSLPVELWARLDIQTKMRITPIYFIKWEPDHMRHFLRRLCGCDPGPLERLELRNPTAVVLFAEELKRRAPEEAFEKRLEDLRRVAQAVSPTHSEELFNIFKALWLKQNIYDDVPKKSRFTKRVGVKYSLSDAILEKVRSYVYAREELHHLIYELLL